MSGLFSALSRSLMLTLFLETVFFLLCGKRDKKDLLLCWLLNLLTNPAVVLLYWLADFFGLGGPAAVLLMEAAAIAVEGWGYRQYGRTLMRPFLFSLAVNLFSYGAGCWLNGL